MDSEKQSDSTMTTHHQAHVTNENVGLDEIIVVPNDGQIKTTSEPSLNRNQLVIDANNLPTDSSTKSSPVGGVTGNLTSSQNKQIALILERINAILLLVVVPLTIFISILVRINYQSVIYLVMLYLLPFMYPVNQFTANKRLRNYLIALMVISIMGLIGQLSFQIVLLANPPYANPTILPNCSQRQKILDEFGYSRFDIAYLSDIFRLLVPEMFVFLIALASLVTNIKTYTHSSLVASRRATLTSQPGNIEAEMLLNETGIMSVKSTGTPRPITTTQHSAKTVVKTTSGSKSAVVRFLKLIYPIISQLVFLLLLFVCSSLLPSLLSTPYLLAYWILCIRWSMNKKLIDTKFQLVLKFLIMAYSAAHLLALYIYQIDAYQLFFQNSNLMSLIGLRQNFVAKCDHPAHLYLSVDRIEQVIIPLCLFVLYWVLAVETAYNRNKIKQILSDANEGLPGRPTEITIARPVEDTLANSSHDEVETSGRAYDEAFLEHVYDGDDKPKTSSQRKLTTIASPLAATDTDDQASYSEKQKRMRGVFTSLKQVSFDADNEAITSIMSSLKDDRLYVGCYSSLRNSIDSVDKVNTLRTFAANSQIIYHPSLPLSSKLPRTPFHQHYDSHQHGFFDHDFYRAKLGVASKRIKRKLKRFNHTIKERLFEGKPKSADLKLRRMRNSRQQSQISTDGSIMRPQKLTSYLKRRQTVGLVYFDQLKQYLNAIKDFFHKQSYLLSLLSMMVWSILYHSILTLVLLVWACLIWVLPKSRLWCLRTSPMFVFYSTCLFFLEFIYGLSILPTDLPEYIEIGLVRHDTPVIHLAVKAGLISCLLLSLKQFIAQRDTNTTNDTSNTADPEASTSSRPNVVRRLSENALAKAYFKSTFATWLHSFLIKYWIFLSSGTLLLMSSQNDVVAYRIVYMALFLYLITTFQLMYSFWRLTLYIFQLIIIIYSMTILLLIYIFQFEEVPSYFKQLLDVDDKFLASIGFIKFDQKDELILRLLTPTTFLIVNILQIHYFNRPWLKLTDEKFIQVQPPTIQPVKEVDEEEEDKMLIRTVSNKNAANKVKKESFLSFAKRMVIRLNSIFTIVTLYAWKFAELHIYKLIVIVIALFCLTKVNLVNFVLFCALLFSFMLDRINSKAEKRVQRGFTAIVQIWVSFFTLLNMFFQLEFVKSPFVTNCNESNHNVSDPFLLKDQDNLVYLGVEKTNDIQSYLQYYIFIFLLLTFERIVKLRMRHYRIETNQPPPVYPVLFENVNWKHLDVDIVHFIKYAVNYGFYRFGLEISFFMTTVVIIIRMDAYAILYGMWLGMFLRMRRATISKVWTVYFIFLLLLLPIQYFWCLGLPPFLCLEYPWSKSNQIDPMNIMNKLRVWLLLPDYSDPPNSHYLIADFFQLFFVWLQMSVFQQESKKILEDTAGNNREILYEKQAKEDSFLPNPYQDFVSESKTYLDKIKYLVFMYSFWIVLAIVFITGTSRISVLCMGYVIFSFFFLWYGQNFLILPLDKLLRYWNIMVFYCFLVIFIKACLQIVLCLLTNEISEKFICILVDIFGIDCRTLPTTNTATSKCTKEGDDSDEIGLAWDVICFLVLLLQRRLYMSYMFQHIVNEYKAQSALAARGAQIFRQIIHQKVESERRKEERVLRKLKENVERIRQHQSKEMKHEPQDHYEALRAGDYYMFDDDCEIESESDADEDTTELTKPKAPSRKESELAVSRRDDVDNIQVQRELETLIIPAGVVQSSIIKSDNSEIKDSFNSKQTVTESTRVTTPPTTSQATTEPQISTPETTETVAATPKPTRQSWLTIENKTLLKIIEVVKKGLIIAFDVTIEYLNRNSRDYRHVSYILKNEKTQLKQEYYASGNLINGHKSMSSIEENQPITEQEYRKAAREVDQFMNSQPRFRKMLSTVFYFMLSQSEIFCYFFMILNHIKSASVLSVFLPISVFLWAMLSIPRPSKTFWVVCITYIEFVIVLKYFFQFKLFSWNQGTTAEDEATKKMLAVIGLDKKDRFALFDLFSLLIIFLHRSILKRLGLWRGYSVEDEALLTRNDDPIQEIQKNEQGDEETQKLKKIVTDSNLSIDNGQVSIINEQTGAEQSSSQEGLRKRSNASNRDELDGDEDETENPDDYEDLAESDQDQDSELDDGEVLVDSGDFKHKAREKIDEAKKNRLVEPFWKFYHDLGSKHYAVVVDCFAKIFLCDFINCIITIFTYQYFGESARVAAYGSSSVVSSIQQNKVPYTFLIMFLVQFVLMIIDRALYLRKNRYGKFIFQIVLVLFVHVWIFFALPTITNLSFSENRAAQVWYFVKCIYFGYSSRQIRCGYPTRILGNFLTKSYNYVNLILFRGFLIIPFLLELRALMDWMFTDTALNLFDWLQMEDIYSNIFILKCNRYNEKKYPVPRGTKRKAIVKYGFGGTLLTGLILIIWFPLLLFSFSEGFNRTVPPQSSNLEIELTGFLPIYSMSSQKRQSFKFSKQDAINFKNSAPEQAYSFVSDFTPEDIYCIKIPGNSTGIWQISPPSLASLKQELQESMPTELQFTYSITRESSDQQKEQFNEIVQGSRQILLMNDTKSALYKLLTGNGTNTNSVLIKTIYPRYVHARAKGNIIEIDSLKNSNSFIYYADVRVSLRRHDNELWWDVWEVEPKGYKPPCSEQGYLSIVVFSDKISPSSISFFTEQGIIGIYITFVLALSRFLRILVVNSSMRIMFEQMPNVDRILKLCHSVYMVRENHQFMLEEQIYSKILFLYRSPETMIKYTRNVYDDDNKINEENKKNQ